MVDRTHRELTNDDIANIATTYHSWRGEFLLPLGGGQSAGASKAPLSASSSGKSAGEDASGLLQGSSPSGRGGSEGDVYQDILGYCKGATLDDIREHGHVLTPGRYVGAPPQEDDGVPFEERMSQLTNELSEQFAESKRLEEEIRKNLEGLGFDV